MAVGNVVLLAPLSSVPIAFGPAVQFSSAHCVRCPGQKLRAQRECLGASRAANATRGRQAERRSLEQAGGPNAPKDETTASNSSSLVEAGFETRRSSTSQADDNRVAAARKDTGSDLWDRAGSPSPCRTKEGHTVGNNTKSVGNTWPTKRGLFLSQERAPANNTSAHPECCPGNCSAREKVHAIAQHAGKQHRPYNRCQVASGR